MIIRNNFGINTTKKVTLIVFLLLYSTASNTLCTRAKKDINFICPNRRRKKIATSRRCVISELCGFNYNRNY